MVPRKKYYPRNEWNTKKKKKKTKNRKKFFSILRQTLYKYMYRRIEGVEFVFAIATDKLFFPSLYRTRSIKFLRWDQMGIKSTAKRAKNVREQQLRNDATIRQWEIDFCWLAKRRRASGGGRVAGVSVSRRRFTWARRQAGKQASMYVELLYFRSCPETRCSEQRWGAKGHERRREERVLGVAAAKRSAKAESRKERRGRKEEKRWKGGGGGSSSSNSVKRWQMRARLSGNERQVATRLCDFITLNYTAMTHCVGIY